VRPSSHGAPSMLGIDETHDAVMVLCTARHHGRGAHRLPDREHRGRVIAAVQVETDEQAREVLAALDAEGRRFYLDVERKQDINLAAVAADVVRRGSIVPIKPNDITVDGTVAWLTSRLGADLSDRVVAVVGTGNLGFKVVLRLAEIGCRVHWSGRNLGKVEELAAAINQVLPRFTPHRICTELPDQAAVLVSAVNAEHIVGQEWVARLEPDALCLDVGINNFSPEFIRAAVSSGRECARMDVRAATSIPEGPSDFFGRISGRTRGRVNVVAGGLIGELGEVVVDQIQLPNRVVGVANGTGGLVDPGAWSDQMVNDVAHVQARIDGDRGPG
jgi:Shikimate / quinate 5-dehydrogenase